MNIRRNLYENEIFGLGGNDDITGGPLNDIIHGGNGNDRFYYSSGNDQYFGGNNWDSIRLNNAPAANINIKNGNINFNGGSNNKISDIESIAGTSFNDVVTFSDNNFYRIMWE